MIENKIKFDERQELRQQRLKVVQANLSELSNGKLTDTTLKKIHQTPIYSGITNPSSGVINSLINTGDLYLIKNDALKNALPEWLELLQNLKENEQILWEANSIFMDFSEKNYPKGAEDLWTNFNELDHDKLRLKFSTNL